MSSDRTFMPAAGRDIFLALYDPLTRLFGLASIQRELLRQAELQPGLRALDVGCGTGTFAVMIKREYPAVDVVALDPDRKALARAQRKARRSDVSVQFDRGFADALPYDNAVFDRVFSSMMFHHLPRSEKEGALREIHRVLKPGGRLEFIDFVSTGAHGLLARVLHPPKYLADNADGRLLDLMTRAGLSEAKRVGFRNTAFGHVGFYQASHAV
jgi:ubiquinone/menaquinone biosynthesis C-methylase UbiE